LGSGFAFPLGGFPLGFPGGGGSGGGGGLTVGTGDIFDWFATKSGGTRPPSSDVRSSTMPPNGVGTESDGAASISASSPRPETCAHNWKKKKRFTNLVVQNQRLLPTCAFCSGLPKAGSAIKVAIAK